MMRYFSIVAGISLLAATAGVLAAEDEEQAVEEVAIEGEFDNQCAMGLAMEQHVDTDCSINWTGTDGNTYCFSDEEAKATFLKDPEGNLKKATEFYETSLEE